MSPVLCYHSVCDAWDHQLSVTHRQFGRQLRWLLRRGFRPVGLDEAITRSGRVFHVTFDDAYRDIRPVLELLESVGARATVFAATAYAEGGHPLAVPELQEEVRGHPARLATMDWGELRDLVERGFEIGSHTVSHPHLSRLSDEELDRELLASRLRCEEELGVPCRYLAYPYGEHDDRVRAAARRAGYSAACALHDQGPKADPFAVPRVDLYRNDSPAAALVKTSALRRPAYAVVRWSRSGWPSAAPFGHGWMVAALPVDATRFRAVDPALAATLLAAGANVVTGEADVELGTPSLLTGTAPLAVTVLASRPHDDGRRALRVARRFFNAVGIRLAALRARRALRGLGYDDVEIVPFDVAQAFRGPGCPRPERRSPVEYLPQRALVIGRRGVPGPTLLDAVLSEAQRIGGTSFEDAVPVLRTGGVLILLTKEGVMRTALGPPAEQITRQQDVLEALHDRVSEPALEERIAWPTHGGSVGLATWSVERRLAGSRPGALDDDLLGECVDFLIALHRTGHARDEPRSLAACAAVVGPYRPEAVARRLTALGESLDSALAHVPRGFGHGDFFAGNLLFDDGRLTGVIDWDGGSPGALPMLDLIHLRHTEAHPLPDDDWGPSVLQFLLPWSRRPADPITERYCEGVGFRADGRTLESLALAYWLDRLAYQIRTHRFRQSRERWLVRSVDHVLDAVWEGAPPARLHGEPVGGRL